MFNKKDDIENDFMDYNSNSNKSEPQSKNNSGGLNSTIQFLIIFILVGIIAIGGIFSYKYLQNDIPIQNSNITNLDNKPIKSENKSQVSVVAQKESPVKHTTSDQKMYTQEQLQEIVKMMMSNMQNKPQNKEIVDDTQNESNDDDDLINSLSNIDVDQMEDLSIDTTDETDSTQKVTNKDNSKIDRYNKVVIDNTNNDLDDLASQLNDTIQSLQDQDSKQSTYTKSISTEVKTRKNEMRVIIVKNGDSLSQIAKRAYGSAHAYTVIMEANPDLIKNPNHIYIGQRLRVPLKIN